MILGVMIARACNDETRHGTITLHSIRCSANARRTRGLYYYYSCFILSELIAPPVASFAAQVSLWLPFGISYLLLVLTFPLLAIMPNGEKKLKRNDLHTDGTAEDFEDTPTPAKVLLRMLVHAAIDQFRLLGVIFSNRNMRLAVPIFLVSTFRGMSLRVLIQYTSFRFGWKLAQARFLLFRLHCQY